MSLRDAISYVMESKADKEAEALKISVKNELKSILRKIHKATTQDEIDSALDRLSTSSIKHDVEAHKIDLLKAEAERKSKKLEAGQKEETPEKETDSVFESIVSEFTKEAIKCIYCNKALAKFDSEKDDYKCEGCGKYQLSQVDKQNESTDAPIQVASNIEKSNSGKYIVGWVTNINGKKQTRIKAFVSKTEAEAFQKQMKDRIVNVDEATTQSKMFRSKSQAEKFVDHLENQGVKGKKEIKGNDEDGWYVYTDYGVREDVSESKRASLLADFKRTFPKCWAKDGREFDGGTAVIWSGEGSYVIEQYPDPDTGKIDSFEVEAFNHYAEDFEEKTWTMGVHNSIVAWADKNGLYFEFYDAGTVLAYQVDGKNLSEGKNYNKMSKAELQQELEKLEKVPGNKSFKRTQIAAVKALIAKMDESNGNRPPKDWNLNLKFVSAADLADQALKGDGDLYWHISGWGEVDDQDTLVSSDGTKVKADAVIKILDSKPNPFKEMDEGVEVTTSKYEFSHGKKPSGTGMWAFNIGGKDEFFNGTYTEAKQKAITLAKEKGISRISVGESKKEVKPTMNKVQVSEKVNEDEVNPEEFLFKNNPELEKGGIVHQAHKPENVLLVWWFNPLTAEFVKSNNPNHIHAHDYRNKINPTEEKQWVRGRVFKSGDKVFLIVYNLKGMSNYLRWDLLAKVSDAIEPNVVSTIIDPEGQDISNMFEGTAYTLTPSKSGYWKAVDGMLVESKINEDDLMSGGATTASNSSEVAVTDEKPVDVTPEPNITTPVEEPKEEPIEAKDQKEYLGNNGTDQYFYLYKDVNETGGVKDLQILDANDEVVFSASENKLSIEDVKAFLLTGFNQIEIANIAYEIVSKYLIGTPDQKIEKPQAEEEFKPEAEQLKPDVKEPQTEEPIKGMGESKVEKLTRLLSKFKLDEAIGYHMKMECLECGAKFSKTISNSTVEVKCPECGGYDTEIAESDQIVNLLAKFKLNEGPTKDQITAIVNQIRNLCKQLYFSENPEISEVGTEIIKNLGRIEWLLTGVKEEQVKELLNKFKLVEAEQPITPNVQPTVPPVANPEQGQVPPVVANDIIPTEQMEVDLAIVKDPTTAEAQIRMEYPEEPMTSTALAYADSLVHDPNVYGTLRNLKWEGLYADAKTFLQQAKIVGNYNGFTPDIAKLLVDSLGDSVKYRLAREGSVAVYFTVRDMDRKVSLDALKATVKADEVAPTGQPGEARLWWD